jgi:hypothetical protein
MAVRLHKAVYRLDELDEPIHHLRSEPLTDAVIQQRRKLAEDSDRFLSTIDPIPIPIEDLLDAEAEGK